MAILITMFSQTAEYALRATIYLAQGQPGAFRVSDVAVAVGAPRNYLAKILGALARAGILSSTRGPAGGFRMIRSADDVRLSDVVALFAAHQGRRCLLGHGACGDVPNCPVHSRWLPVSISIDRFLSSTTVAQLLVASRQIT